MIFGSVKDVILELLDSCLGTFRAKIIVGKLRAHLEPKTCGCLGSFRKEDPIVSFYHLISEVNCEPCLQESRPHD